MRKKRILSLILVVTMIMPLLTACGEDVIHKVQEQGNVQQSVELDQAKDEDSPTPTYDINSLEESTVYVDFKEKDSYFKQQLDSRNLIVYNEIKNAYEGYKNEVLLSKTITEEELFKIISIMYTDDSEMFQIKPQYDYYLDTNGYVYKINLYYSLDQITYRSYCDRLENSLLGIYSNLTKHYEKTDEITEYMVLKYLMENITGTIKIYDTSSKEPYTTSIISFINNNNKWTSQGYAKYFSLICRYLGLDCAVVMGKLTNDDYAKALTKNNGYNIESFSDLKIEKSGEGNSAKYSVKFNFDNYFAWNIIKINDSWYHFDNILPLYIVSQNSDIMTVSEHGQLLYYVNDYTISMSRIFYYSENLLGKVPLCTSKQFQQYYRDGKYLLSHTEEQMLTFLTSYVEILQSRNTNRFIYQFEDEETYDYFLNNFDKVVTSYNNSGLQQIINYEVREIRDELTLIYCNLKYKN